MTENTIVSTDGRDINPRYRYTPEQVIEALQHAKGIQVTAAEYLGCSRWTISNYIKRFPEIEQAYQEEINKTNDKVHSKLLSHIFQDEDKKISLLATMFYQKAHQGLRDSGANISINNATITWEQLVQASPVTENDIVEGQFVDENVNDNGW